MVCCRHEMKSRLMSAVIALTSVAGLSVAHAELKTAAPKDVNLTAIWKINPKLSDDPYKVVARKREDSANPGGMGPPPSRGGIDAGDIFGGGTVSGTLGRGGTVSGTIGGVGGTYGGGRRGGATRPSSPDEDPDAEGPSTARMPLDSFLSTREQFEIEQLPDALTVRTVEESNTCKPGETGKVPIQGGDMVDRRCGWQGSTFVVELVSDDGTTRVNRYELRNKNQLVMTSEIKGGKGHMRGLKIKRVYERLVAF